MELIVNVLLLFILCIAIFYMVCYGIKLWKGCNFEEAVTTLQNVVSGKAAYDFTTDAGFGDEIWLNVKNVIGERRFQRLVALSNTEITTPLLVCGKNSGLPFVAISVYYEDENEKMVLENVISSIVVRYLRICAFDTRICTEWKKREDLKMPYLEIRYARTPDEKRILSIMLTEKQKRITDMETDVIDETGEDEFYE